MTESIYDKMNLRLSHRKSIYDSNLSGVGVSVIKYTWISKDFPIGTQKKVDYEVEYFDEAGNMKHSKSTENPKELIEIVEKLKKEDSTKIGEEYVTGEWKKITETT